MLVLGSADWPLYQNGGGVAASHPGRHIVVRQDAAYGAPMNFKVVKFVTLTILWSVLALSIVEQARGMFGFPPLLTSVFF